MTAEPSTPEVEGTGANHWRAKDNRHSRRSRQSNQTLMATLTRRVAEAMNTKGT